MIQLPHKEATRDGAIAIDIVDGEKLAEKLRELGLGLKIELTGSITVDEDWFKNLRSHNHSGRVFHVWGNSRGFVGNFALKTSRFKCSTEVWRYFACLDHLRRVP